MGHKSVDRLSKNEILQICVDTGCHLEYLLSEMAD